MPALNLIIIRSSQVDASLTFYRAVGLDFTPERHGTGAQHFAATIGGTVFEIYPAGNDGPSRNVRLGFVVDAIAETIGRLTDAGGCVLSAPAESPWGRRAVMSDPEGIRVELIESRST